RRAVALAPDDAHIHSGLLYTLLFHPQVSDVEIDAAHRQWEARHAAPLQSGLEMGRRGRGRGDDPPSTSLEGQRRLRIGYVSPDFRDHVVGRNVLPILRRHDRGAFEMFCYSDVGEPDALTAEFRACADIWRDVGGRSDEEVARQVA